MSTAVRTFPTCLRSPLLACARARLSRRRTQQQRHNHVPNSMPEIDHVTLFPQTSWLFMLCLSFHVCGGAGSTFAPEGAVLDAGGGAVDHPADQPCLAQLAACSALCNDSSLYFNAGASQPRVLAKFPPVRARQPV